MQVSVRELQHWKVLVRYLAHARAATHRSATIW